MREDLEKIVLSDAQVDFGDRYTFPRNAATSYKSQKGKSENYRLDTVLFFLKHRKQQAGLYMRSVCCSASSCSPLRIEAAPLQALLQPVSHLIS